MPRFNRLVGFLFAAVAAPLPGAGAERAFTDCGDCPEMVIVAPGPFRMGAPVEEARALGLSADLGAREQPVHGVTIQRPFAVAKYEISQAEFARFADATGYAPEPGCWHFLGSTWEFDKLRSWKDAGIGQTPEHPVTCVNWHDATAYARWLSRLTGKPYRLLSEAEWEFAARAGTASTYWFGEVADICQYVNLGDLDTGDRFDWPGTASDSVRADPWKAVPCRDGFATTAPVRTGRPNPFGLYHMLGNVMEWVADCWHNDYTDGPFTEAPRDFPRDCGYRVMRGQGWVAIAASARAAFRRKMDPNDRRFTFGIRIARDVGEGDR